eukprot:gene7220-8028_t
MTSKLAVKTSKKERPRSSEKVGGSKLAKKAKDAETPENKLMSPVNMSCQTNDVLSNSPLLTESLMEGEMKLLRINPSELKSSVVPAPPKTEKSSNKVLVRKKVPISSLPKEKKSVIVARRAPSDASIKLPNPEDYPGLRLDESGAIIPHSIVGSVDEFVQQATLRGDKQVESLPCPSKSSPSPWPENGSNKINSELKKIRQIHINETRALTNWEKQMKNRRREQNYLSESMGVPADMLLMNQDEDFRAKQEQRMLIDRAIPSMDYGKGYRTGSEFWKQVENIGGDFGINMTLTQTERGYAPAVEHIGKPDSTRLAMGTDWYVTRRMAHIHYPWLKSEYLNQRKDQLRNVIDELTPHKPYIEGLEIVGQSLKTLQNSNDDMNNNAEHDDLISESTEPTLYEEELPDPLAQYEDVIPLPIFGPSLTINGHSAAWNSSSANEATGDAITIRLQFESAAGSNSRNSIDITNDGTAAIYYSWRRVPTKDPFGLKKTRPLQRFYFDTRNGVILPNDSIKIPFSFKSPNAGIFNEKWQFETQPVLCKGAPISIILRGIATQEDQTARQRKELEDELDRKATQTMIDDLVKEILNGVRSPPRPASPIDSYLTEEEMFARKNEKLNFNFEAITDLKDFHEQLDTNETWDMSLNTLLEGARSNEDEEAKESMILKLNADVEMFAFQSDEPVKNPCYNRCYQLLCEAMDSFYAKANALSSSMGLPSKEFKVEIQPEEVSKKGKKVQDSAKGDKKQDPKKKDNRPSSSLRGKTPAPKSKSKETVMLAAPKQAVDPPVEKKPSEPSEPKSIHPLSARYNENLYIQLYDILDEMVGRMEESVLTENADGMTIS